MTKIDKFETKLIKTVKKYKMLESGDRVLVCLSGGKDSVSLLYALSKLSNYLSISLCAFHLNHGIRGEEANSDEALSQKTADALCVPFTSKYADIPSKLKDASCGLEALAREIRYKEIFNAAKKFDCNKIATAHTASDNSETMLMTLMRNSNAKGIPPVRDNIIRPLIDHTTAEVLDYCARNSLTYATDSTNADDVYTRNYVRHNILPSIYKMSPSFDETLSRFSSVRRSDLALTDFHTKKYFDENADPLNLSSLKQLSENCAFYNVLYNVIAKALKTELSFSQLDDIIFLLNNGNTGQRIDLSNGISLVRGYDRIELAAKNTTVSNFEILLRHGKNQIPDSDIVLWLETPEEYTARIKLKSQKNLNVNKITKNSLIKYNIMSSSLIARSRKEGDFLICRGMKKSIKKYMIDTKIPASIRSRIPIVCCGDDILWVPGLGTADFINADKNSSDVLSLSLEFENL